jgi:diaminopimelate decarboxylase
MATEIASRLRLALRDEARAYRGPTLVFDLRRIRERMQRLAELGDRHRCRFLMAAKAFRSQVVYRLAADLLGGFDVSNASEYAELPAGLGGKLVSFTNPVLRGEDLVGLRSKGNSLVVFLDALSQLESLRALREEVDFGIRLASTCFVEPHAGSRPPPRKQSRFGVEATDDSALRALLAAPRHRFLGFHLHHGYGGNPAQAYVRMARGSLELARSLGATLRLLDLGGGLQRVPESELAPMLEELRRVVPESIELVFEPGELLTMGCGFALARVEVSKRRSDAYVCTLDLSAAWHLHWSRPALLAGDRREGSRQHSVAFYGPTCSEHDFVGEFATAAGPGREPFRPGDIVCFEGISGYSVSCNGSFNGVPPARVVFIE